MITCSKCAHLAAEHDAALRADGRQDLLPHISGFGPPKCSEHSQKEVIPQIHLACPFCADRDIRSHCDARLGWSIQCHSCPCELSWFATEQEAWERWDKRAGNETPPVQAPCVHPASALFYHAPVTGNRGDWRCDLCDTVIHLPAAVVRTPETLNSLRTPQGEPALTQTDGLPGTREPVVAASKDNAGESPAPPWPWQMCTGCGNEPNACTCDTQNGP